MSLLKIKAVRVNGTIEVDARLGQHITRIIEDLLHLALDQCCNVVTRVNGVELTARPTSSFGELLLDYDRRVSNETD